MALAFANVYQTISVILMKLVVQNALETRIVQQTKLVETRSAVIHVPALVVRKPLVKSSIIYRTAPACQAIAAIHIRIVK